MNDADSPALLAAYVGGRQEAFAELVRWHVDLVYSTALRRVNGDAHLARDVVQLVFIDLALKAGSLPTGVVLGGWLHHHTCFRAATLVRSEQRRRAREEKAATMNALEKQSSETWSRLAPHLDEALERLATRDRDLIVLRYFEGRTLAEVGRCRGLTEDAAQKAVSRALEKLRGHFLKRNLATASGALAAALTANSVQAAPAGLGAATTQFALAGAMAVKALAPATSLLTTLLMTTKTKIAVVLSAGAAGLALLVSTQRENARLRDQVTVLQAAQDSRASTRVGPSSKSASTTDANNSAAPVALLPSDEVENMLARLIESRIWRTDGRAFDRAMQSIDIRDMPRALAFVARTATGESRNHITFALVDHWARQIPEAAAAWSETLALSAERNRVRNAIASRWAEKDPQAALQTLGPSGSVLNELAKKSPTEAARTVLEIPPGHGLRENGLRSVAHNWFETDPQAAVRWINTLDNPDDRGPALGAVIQQLAETTPQETATYIQTLPPHPHYVQLGSHFAEVWASSQPAAAAAWSARLPENSPLRDQALTRVASRWGEDQPTAAAAWLETLRGPSRDIATKAFVRKAAEYEPQLAAQWALSLSQETSRHEAIEQVAHEWLSIDPGAARTWLAQTTLPEERKQKLLARH